MNPTMMPNCPPRPATECSALSSPSAKFLPARRRLGAALLAMLALGLSSSTAATITLTGTTDTKYTNASPADGTIFDATQWTSTAVKDGGPNTAVVIGPTNTSATGPKNITWLGGLIIGSIPTTWDWTTTHSFGGAGVIIHNNTFAEWKFLRVHNVEDGMKPREAPEWSNGGSWMLRDSYFTAIRDDCIENDRFEPGTVQDCLFDGVHTFISEQKEAGFPSGAVSIGPNESNTIYVKRVYVRLYPTNAFDSADDQFPGPGKWFKWQGDAEAPNHQVRVEDSVFAVGTIPRNGWGNLSIPSQVTWVGTNNFILWLGAVGAYQGPKPSGVTFLEGSAAEDKWRTVRNNWLTSHGMASLGTRAANSNPHNLPSIDRVPATAADTTPPATPTGLTATAGDAQVALDWANNTESDLAGYNVYRNTDNFLSPRNASLLTVSNYTDTGLTNGTTYTYVVTAIDNAANESPDSAQVSATPTAATPTVYDANALTVASSSGAVKDSPSLAGASNGNFMRYKNTSVSGYITFNVSVPAPATYTINVRYVKLPYGGVVQLAIDGTNQGSTTDLYAASQTLDSSRSFGTKSLTAGTHAFKFFTTGKNASSNSYYIAIDTITLTP